MKDNKYIIPISIVLAGLIIAGAIFMTRAPATTGNNQNAQGQQPADTKLAIRNIDASDHLLGSPGAKITIVEYSDSQCPYCKTFDKTMQQIMSIYGKDSTVAWVYRHLPLDSIHPDARRRALALECAASIGGNAKYWAFSKDLYGMNDQDFQGTPNLGVLAVKAGIDENAFNTCVTEKRFEERVNADIADAARVGANGTPFNVLVVPGGVNDSAKAVIKSIQAQTNNSDIVFVSDDGKRIAVKGALPLNMMQAILDALLK